MAGAIVLHIVNSLLGAGIVFRRMGRPPRRAHFILYLGVLACLGIYFYLNRFARGNGLVEYFVLLYFAIFLPLSRKWDVMIHAFIAVVGLTFLPLLILVQIL